MEVINDLLNYKNMKIVQNTDWFAFSLDSVLLCNFIKLKNNCKIIDFCTGNAPIPLILSTKTKNNIIGVELQKEVFELAQKSVKINGLEDKIDIINCDVKDLPLKYETDTFDYITCNPPYFKISDESKINDNDVKSVARHEIKLNLNDIFSVSKKLLKNNGKIVMVHRTDRFMDVITTMREYNIEPKRVQFVFPKEESESNMFLIEGCKNGSTGLKILPPLYVHDSKGEYLDHIKEMFE